MGPTPFLTPTLTIYISLAAGRGDCRPQSLNKDIHMSDNVFQKFALVMGKLGTKFAIVASLFCSFIPAGSKLLLRLSKFAIVAASLLICSAWQLATVEFFLWGRIQLSACISKT